MMLRHGLPVARRYCRRPCAADCSRELRREVGFPFEALCSASFAWSSFRASPLSSSRPASAFASSSFFFCSATFFFSISSFALRLFQLERDVGFGVAHSGSGGGASSGLRTPRVPVRGAGDRPRRRRAGPRSTIAAVSFGGAARRAEHEQRRPRVHADREPARDPALAVGYRFVVVVGHGVRRRAVRCASPGCFEHVHRPAHFVAHFFVRRDDDRLVGLRACFSLMILTAVVDRPLSGAAARSRSHSDRSLRTTLPSAPRAGPRSADLRQLDLAGLMSGAVTMKMTSTEHHVDAATLIRSEPPRVPLVSHTCPSSGSLPLEMFKNSP